MSELDRMLEAYEQLHRDIADTEKALDDALVRFFDGEANMGWGADALQTILDGQLVTLEALEDKAQMMDIDLSLYV